MDLGTKLMNETAEMVVNDPDTGSATDVVMTLAGLHSETCRKANGVIQARRRRLRVTYVSPEQAEADALEMLVACTLDWKNFQWEGAEFPYSKENTKVVYQRLPWLRGQVDAFIGDNHFFLVVSSSNS